MLSHRDRIFMYFRSMHLDNIEYFLNSESDMNQMSVFDIVHPETFPINDQPLSLPVASNVPDFNYPLHYGRDPLSLPISIEPQYLNDQTSSSENIEATIKSDDSDHLFDEVQLKFLYYIYF